MQDRTRKELIPQLLRSGRLRLAESLRLLLLLLAVVSLMQVSGVGCPIRFLTGIPCAGCGMTHAALSLLRGHFTEAFAYHPLCFALPFAALAWFFRDLFPEKLRKILGWLLAAAFAAVYLFRITHDDPFLRIDLPDGFILKIIKEVQHVLY